jgi:hypothetical protein
MTICIGRELEAATESRKAPRTGPELKETVTTLTDTSVEISSESWSTWVNLFDSFIAYLPLGRLSPSTDSLRMILTSQML